MKQLFFLCVFVLAAAAGHAQTCTPDPLFVDSSGVFPLPYDSIAQTGGIPVSACIGKPFEFTFTISNSGPFDYNGIPIEFPYVRLDSTGSAITGMPVGYNYTCNPPNCKFIFGTSGCVKIYGTANVINQPGNYDLIITGFIPLFGNETPVTFPGPIFPGKYTLELEPNTSTSCLVSVKDAASLGMLMGNSPNPFADQTAISVVMHEAGAAQLSIFDIHGRLVSAQEIYLMFGQNDVPFDGSALTEGTYVYRIARGYSILSGQMVIMR
jgi:hypothetical protein